MKKIFTPVAFFFCIATAAQKIATPTDTIFVSGQVKKEWLITSKDVNRFPAVALKDIVLTNHLGEVKRTVKGLKGVLLKSLLDTVKFDVESPKLLSEFYFTFIAVDGYKVVFSWNEIYNTATGDNLYVITEKDGQKLKDMKDRILVASTSDFKTGRRYIEGLKRIIVGRVK